MNRRAFVGTSAALLGIVVAAVLTWSASQLAGQRIGLASQPFSVTNGLSPEPSAAPAQQHARVAGHSRPHRPIALPATPAPTATTTSSPGWTATSQPIATVASPPAYMAPAPSPPPATTAQAPPPAQQSQQASPNNGGDGQGDAGGGGGNHRDD